MLTIQQLIKALRKLQNSNTTAKTAVDLAKYLKKATATTTTATSTAQQQALFTSLLHSEQESNHNFGALQTPNQQATEQAETNETTATFVKSKSTDSSQNFSHASNSATFSSILQAQDQVKQNDDNNDEDSKVSATIEHLNTFVPSNIRHLTQQSTPQQDFATFHQQNHQHHTNHHHHRSQQIQKFYQQQLLHFHTQQNSNLQAKQQQTQFAMSSLAAAVDPRALKQQTEEETTNGTATTAAVAAANGDGGTSGATSSSSNSSNGIGCQNDKSKDGAAPCFNTGFAEILKFMELIGNLKHTKRTGWVLRDVSDCESISGHMYRMSMMTFLLDGTEGLNQIRCMELALVHDLAESLVGDITPFCGISKSDKRAMEFKAMDDICKLIEPRGKRIKELFEEYEHGESAESKFVKDLDRLDMVMQAFEYEKRDNCLLKHQEFFDSTEGKFNHPFVKKVVDEIVAQRKQLAQVKGATPPPSIKVPDMDAEEVAAAARNGHCDGEQQKNSHSS